MDTILFDLDGTLLPMEMESFTRAYFSELAKACAPMGFAAEPLVQAVWAGTRAMVKNDGAATNEQRFWEIFSQELGPEVLELKQPLEDFYAKEFHNARRSVGENPAAAPLIHRLRQQGYTLVLASNPIFPAAGFRTRLSWIDLTPEDFDLVTTYEQFHACKPNLRYYQEILETLGKEPADCLMVGNDIQEDGCVTQLGIPCRIVTDYLLGELAALPANAVAADFSETATYLLSLPPLRS